MNFGIRLLFIRGQVLRIRVEDTQAFLTAMRSSQPTLERDVKVTTVWLSEAYELALRAKESQENLEFAYVPSAKQVSVAIALINDIRQKENKTKIEVFNGVPLFAAQGGTQGGYLTVQQDTEQIVPFFFNHEELQFMIDRFKQEFPQLAHTISIQVLDLQGVIDTFRTNDNPQLEQVWLIPPQASLDFIARLGGGISNPPHPNLSSNGSFGSS